MRKLLWITAACAALACGQGPDLIVENGRIVTVDAKGRVVEALAIRGDRIVAAGARTDIAKLAGPNTKRLDLKGKTVLPGLIDSHTHSASAAMYEFDHPIPDMESVADVLKYFRARAVIAKPGDWLELSQVFITRLKEQRFPTRAELDEVAPDNPVCFRTGPDASVNSLALKLSGIDRNFQITDGQPGRVERDSSGEPTGILRSCSRFIRSRSTARRPTADDRRGRIKLLMADYNSVGITSVSERDLGDAAIESYRDLRDRGELTCRVFVMHSIDGQQPIDEIESRIAAVARSPLHQRNNMLWVRGMKVYLDGGMLTGSAYMLEPWGASKVYSITDPTYRGMRFIEPSKLYRIFRAALRNDLQPTAHSVGDAAVAAMVEAYSEINNEFRVAPGRPCISHANFMTAEAIAKMKALGIVLDMQPAWLWLDGATLLKQFGNQRLSYFQPYKSLFDSGVVAGGGSDHMQKIGSFRSINPYNPFLGMWATLKRQPRWMDSPLHPEQRITREQAIRLYTANNAFLTFEEKEKGSLEAGKLADFIVLDTDILTCPLDRIKDIQVERTYLGGKLVYEKR